ncbi:MAG TPA: penicillin-binding protein activator [Burkholderiales bacterium]
MASEAAGSTPLAPIALPQATPLPVPAPETLQPSAPPPPLAAPAVPLIVPSLPPTTPAVGPVPAPIPPHVAGPHLALLLPLGSNAFGKHALAVKDGFLAAARAQGGTSLPVNIYAIGDDPQQIVETYIKALGVGARVVVGPLTRGGVTALAESATVIVPTLALNVPEGQIPAVPGFYMLSLHAESEARQVAQLAWQGGHRSALTVIGETPLLRRIHFAFVEEFTRLGGTSLAPLPFTTDPEGLVRIKKAAEAAIDTETGDMVFMALDLARARLVRPYLSTLPIYATSQVHPGVAAPLVAFDLADVQFLDMPWLLQPEKPVVMVYPRPEYDESVELSRFYALGIDAFRVAMVLLGGKPGADFDGVTGKLTLGPDSLFVRALTAARFNEGRLIVREQR